MAEGADLYDDLFQDVDDSTPFISFHKSDTREEEFRKKEAELNGKVELLQTEVEALQQEKAALTRNISCLFKTAQMELARKDKQMKELRDENLRFKLGGTKGQTNARPHLNKAAPVDKFLGQDEKNHHMSGAVGAPDGRQDKRLQSYQLGSNDSRGSHSHVTLPSSEAAGVDFVFNSEESTRSRRSGSSERGRIRESGHRQSSLDDGKKRRSPSRGYSQQRDTNPDTAHVTYKNLHSDSRPGDTSRYDDKVVRHGDRGHSKCRSPDQRSRDRNNTRDSENSRKRHRSLSRERDEDSERSRAPKSAANTRGSRERLSNDHSDRASEVVVEVGASSIWRGRP